MAFSALFEHLFYRSTTILYFFNSLSAGQSLYIMYIVRDI